MLRVSIFIMVSSMFMWPAMAASNMKLMTQHPSHPQAPDSIWLKEYRMMRIETLGPTKLAISFRQVLVPDQMAGPVDLTIVRDDEEQGTIRFSTPGKDGELSDTVLLVMNVPVGTHTYRMLVSGPQRGVVVKFLEGRVDPENKVIEVTTSLEKKEGLKYGLLQDNRAKPQKNRNRSRKSTMRSQTDVLDTVPVSRGKKSAPQTSLLYNNPDVPTSTLGPGAMAAGGMMFVFLLSSASLAASAGVQSQRAREYPSMADEYLGKARRANDAALVMAGAAGLALVTAVVMYLVEYDDSQTEGIADEPASRGFSVRF